MNDNYCNACCSDAAKHGRIVGKNGYCSLCDSRRREGLIHYRPSNGTEGRMFMGRCSQCRHFIDDSENPQPPKTTLPGNQCQWAILDHLFRMLIEDGQDSMACWFSPQDIEYGCPAKCLRFTPKNYGSDDRDPPPPVDPNQMTFDDLDVPCEITRLIVRAQEEAKSSAPPSKEA